MSSVTINEVTDQSGAGVVAMAFLLGERGCCYGGDFARRNWDNAAHGLCYLAMVYVIGTNCRVKAQIKALF